jgi:predicted transcriptional regulator
MYISKSRTPTLDRVLKKIADDKTMTLFISIALSKADKSHEHLRIMNLSKKQYYSRVSGLLKSGLIKRQKGEYSLTLFGRVICDAQVTISQALNYYWKLKSIESIQNFITNKKLPPTELLKIIDTLIDNHKIKDNLMGRLLAFEDKPANCHHYQ